MADDAKEKTVEKKAKHNVKAASTAKNGKQAEKPAAKKQRDAKPAGKKKDEMKSQPLPANDPMKILNHVHMTEKSVRSIEAQNQIVFIVNRSASKREIRDAMESVFKERIRDVRTTIDQKGRKKAFVKFAKEGAAGDIAIKLGII